MSVCVLGMSEEFKKDGVAVNALWPQTGEIMNKALCLDHSFLYKNNFTRFMTVDHYQTYQVLLFVLSATVSAILL